MTATLLEPPKSRARVWLAGWLLVVYGAFVVAVTLSPIPVDQGYRGAIMRALEAAHRHGVPLWFGYNELEFTGNVLMFLPLGFLISLALPARLWWLALLIVPALSIAIELTQGAVLPRRFEDVRDVVSNTAGGWVGAVLAVGLRRVVNARDKTVLARAIWEYEQGMRRAEQV